jgi:hypothetical protein
LKTFAKNCFETKKELASEIMRVAYAETKDHPYIMLNVETDTIYLLNLSEMKRSVLETIQNRSICNNNSI